MREGKEDETNRTSCREKEKMADNKSQYTQISDATH